MTSIPPVEVEWDRLRNADYTLGELFFSEKRYAMWTLREPFGAWITLEDENGTYEGACFQGEKAEGVCIRWVEEGVFSVNFRTDYPR